MQNNISSPKHLISTISDKLSEPEFQDSNYVVLTKVIIDIMNSINQCMYELIKNISSNPNSNSYKILNCKQVDDSCEISSWFTENTNNNTMNISTASIQTLVQKLFLLFRHLIIQLKKNINCDFDFHIHDKINEIQDKIKYVQQMTTHFIKDVEEKKRPNNIKLRDRTIKLLDQPEQKILNHTNPKKCSNPKKRNNERPAKPKSMNQFSPKKNFFERPLKQEISEYIDQNQESHSQIKKSNETISSTVVTTMPNMTNVFDVSLEEPVEAIELDDIILTESTHSFSRSQSTPLSNLTDSNNSNNDELIKISMATVIDNVIYIKPMLIKKSHLLKIKSDNDIMMI